jgi:2-amino-4-hydroxy-6-hydroxymethyldihydropteridine diphosphokinase
MRVGGELVYVAVGANLGDREATFARVLRFLEVEKDLLLLAASPVFETEPVGPGRQGPYLNAALRLRSWLSPIELLGRLQEIEDRLGRDRSGEVERWGPRRIDLDILFFGDRCIEMPELIVPHPRAHERAFVLMPMVELDPDFAHPILGKTMSQIARLRSDLGAVRRWRRPAGWPDEESDA